MNAVRAHPSRQIDNPLHVEEPLNRSGSDEMRLVGLFHINCGGLALGVNGCGADGKFPAGPDDPHGDLAAIGNQDFFKHAATSS